MFADVEALGADAFCPQLAEICRAYRDRLIPPELISTVDCAERYRKLPTSEAGVLVPYDRSRTPYNVGPMDALDDAGCNLVVMVKPSRSGGTTVAENYAFKMMRFGPMGRISWFLNSDDAARDYCLTAIKPMFDAHPDLSAKITGVDNLTAKEVSGYPVEFLSAKDGNFRNREPLFMVSDETDAWPKRFAASPVVQIEARQKQIGRRRKAIVMSHPDKGWSSGVGKAYGDTSRGIYVMACAECGMHASAYATRYWEDVPAFKLHYEQRDQAALDERLDVAERTAAMACPHCGALLDDDQRKAMVDGGDWMHRGQTLDPATGIEGEPEPTHSRGFWVHGLMLKTANVGELARGLVKALDVYERTKDANELREFMSKQLGEIFEGKATTSGLSAAVLKQRVKESEFDRGVFPEGASFITAAVDTGGGKFDVGWWAWDLESRSWLIDRITIRQRLWPDGEMRDLALAERIDDWMLLLPRVANRMFLMAGRPDMEMPVAAVAVDSGDGNVTWKAREFARRSIRAGCTWKGWPRIRLIKGSRIATAPILPVVPRQTNKDENGKAVAPAVQEFDLGVHRLKELALERLSISDGSPGQCHFAADIESRYIDEFFGESLIDGKWVRSGRNESLDLFGYAEAVRQMLRPERADINWTDGPLPLWARPVPVQATKGGDPAVAAKGADAAPQPKKSILERFDDLNR